MCYRMPLNRDNKGTLLIIDFLSLYYRGAHVHSGLSHEGVPTGGLYGMVTQVATAIGKAVPDSVIFCSDSKPYLRTTDYPEYKMGRSRKSIEELKELRAAQKLCRNFVDSISVPFIKRKGLEADDLIALLVKDKHRDYGRIVVASSDSDLYQLFVYSGVEFYQGSQKGFYTHGDFKNDYPAIRSPAQWNEILAYSGGHNGLNGIKGIGVKTAIKIVNKEKLPTKIKKAIADNAENTAVNVKVGELPYYKIKNRVLAVHKPDSYNERALIRFLYRYGITATKGMCDAFASIHSGGTY